MQKRNLYRTIYLLTIALCVAVDQWTKQLIRLNFKLGETHSLLPGVLSFTYSENDGALGGLFSNQRWVFMVFSTIALLVLSLYLFRGVSYLADRRADGTFPPIDFLCGIALSLIVGGGIGNMVDRLSPRAVVVDFIHVPIVKMINFGSFPPTLEDFPIFNGADSCVTVGATLLIVYLIITLFRSKKDKKEREESPK